MSTLLGNSKTVTCFYHYSIGKYSTVHFSVTTHSKCWRYGFFLDSFGALILWIMHI